MPGAAPERNELNDLPVAPHQEVGAYHQTPDLAEILVRVPIKLIQEQLLNLRPTELAGRQADPVHNDQLRIRIVRPLVLILRRALARLAE